MVWWTPHVIGLFAAAAIALGGADKAVAFVPSESITEASAARSCLSSQQRRAVQAQREIADLGHVLGLVRRRYGGDVVRVQLCRHGRDFVYVLTVLARNGKVAHVTVDATTGRLVGRH